ncbi:hypothetical protein [Salimicrobium album]|uniref:Uncharacterized protein n=1 Tax=Salimicrobium album TaxID=50717 RepID=A0A1H3DGI0_9BACI|nr:hypothetical protein [Salimicrobium album]SDX65218.1 hypothetical protein SAMN04488081_0949 [Salimicrobium album]
MKVILCQPAIKRFEWELEVCLTRLQQIGVTDIVLLFTKQDNRIPSFFKENYGVDVHSYKDERTDKAYIPSIKPYLWMRYLQEDPSRENDTYFYIDSDVLIREMPTSKPTESTWVASDCHPYLSVDYIDSKGEGLLKRMCDVVGVDEGLIREKDPIGGAQWLLKKPTYEYWKKVYKDSVNLFRFLTNVEAEYKKKHDASYVPIQRWTAEMWAQLWNVHHFGKEVEVPKEMDFSWPTNDMKRYEETKIFHNAGVTNDKELFFKGKYTNHTPFEDDFSYVRQDKASYAYVKAIQEVMSMAKYKVVAGFRDKETGKAYVENDTFPRPANKKVSAERIKELSSENNNAKKVLIKKVKE